MEKKHSISVISNTSGIKPHTIRIWEKRYQVFTPDRDENGKRFYKDSDITKAKLLAELLDYGYGISALAAYTIEELQALKDQQKKLDVSSKKSVNETRLNKLLEHLDNYKIDAVADELQYFRLNSSAREYILDLILPTIREIGNLVAKGKYSITQEHIISTIIRDQLSQIYLPNLGRPGHDMALATPDGNMHEFSILIADILCRTHRITTRYLGAAHPADCLSQAVNALKTHTLILGAISSDQWDYEKQIGSYLTKIDEGLEISLVVVLGGGYEIDLPKFKNIKEVKFYNSFEAFDEYLGGLE